MSDRPYDITLQTKDSATVLNANLAPRTNDRGEVVGRMWRRFRGKPFADVFRTDTNGATDPSKELFFYQTDWREGALEGEYEPGSKRYRRGSFDARYGDLMRGIGKNLGTSRGNTRSVIGVALANPGFEATGPTDWTDLTGGTLTLDATANPRTTMAGSQHMRIVADSSGQGAKVVALDHTDWRGLVIKFGGYLTRSTGSSNGIKLTIDDGVATADSSTITAASYTYAEASITVSGSSTKLEFIIQSTGSDTFDADDMTVYSGASLEPTRIAEITDGIYCCFGRMICQLQTGTANKFKWEPVHIATGEFTDLISYKDRLYAALGHASDYIYSDSGVGAATANFTVASAGTTIDNRARYWAVVRDELWKTESDSTVRKGTADPSDGNDWGTAIVVGTDDSPMTALFSPFDGLWVGKEDGYWSYRRVYNDGTSANDFINQKPGYENILHPDNFGRGVADPEGRWFYVRTGRTGLFRHNEFNKERIGESFTLPALDLSGRVGALTSDNNNTYVFADDQLYALPTDEVQPHTMTAPTVGSTGNAQTSPAQENTTATFPGTATGGTDPNNIKASDDARASTGSTGNATISLDIRLDGSKIGNTKSFFDGNLPVDSDQTDTFGSTSDVWGTSLSKSDINNSTFGVEVTSARAGSGPIIATNFSFSVPSGASIDGIKLTLEHGFHNSIYKIDGLQITVYFTVAAQESAGIYTKQAKVVEWSVSSVDQPHLLGVIYGLDSTDSQPYAWTDCYAIPLNATTPDLNDTDIGNPAGFHEFGTWDGGEEFADVTKAIDSITCRFRGMTGAETVTFKMGTDGAASDSVTVGNFGNTDNVQTLFTNDMTSPESQAIGKSFLFRLSVVAAPKGFAIESILVRAHATQAREVWWEFDILSAGAMLNTGLEAVQSGEEVIDLLETLEDSAYPIELVQDLREEGTDVTTTCDIIPDSIEEIDTGRDSLGGQSGVIRVLIRERKVS